MVHLLVSVQVHHRVGQDLHRESEVALDAPELVAAVQADRVFRPLSRVAEFDRHGSLEGVELEVYPRKQNSRLRWRHGVAAHAASRVARWRAIQSRTFSGEPQHTEGR